MHSAAAAGANQLCTLICLTARSSRAGRCRRRLAKPAYSGLPGVLVESAGLQVRIQKSIVSALGQRGNAATRLSDCIVDATVPTQIAYAASDGSSGAAV